MRFGALLSFCALLSCGARTPLREPDDCPEAFAEGVNDFDLADDEAIVARNDAIVALRKSDGAERVIVAERAERVVTNGCELAWMTGSNVDRARLDGTERRNLHKSIGWDETSLDAIAIDAIGNVALTRTFGSSASTEVFSVSGSRRSVAAYGPSLTFRDGIVYGSRGGVLHLARIGDEDPTVLLADTIPDGEQHGGPVRVSSDGAVWLRSGRDDVPPQLTWMLPRIDRVAADRSITTPYRATFDAGLGFDVDDRALIVATNLERGWSGLRIEELTHAGANVRRLAWCPRYQGTPTVRVDASYVWVRLARGRTGAGKLYRFPRETSW